ncbi:hypothetical protein [Paenibacillus agricola]|uniref:Plasmid replication protein RepL domain-containing protein n=1 Tax=Paenibacillus agricola TaxID=2716264 RepID=A0ABX0J7I2_9BACL|nr:hypothetical protein [Paenibacillus agricola]NHN31144.1 hypothetical protein [Paenibacillus agricola]
MSNVIDTQTGEIIDEVNSGHFRNGTDDTVKVAIDVKPGETVRPYKARKFSKSAEFTMVFHGSTRELVRKRSLSDDEKSLLFSLLIYLDYDQYAKDESAFFFNVNRIAELMGWSRARAGRVLESLCSPNKKLLGYTTVGKAKYYMMNPNFIYRGDTSGLQSAIRMFEQSALDDE